MFSLFQFLCHFEQMWNVIMFVCFHKTAWGITQFCFLCTYGLVTKKVLIFIHSLAIIMYCPHNMYTNIIWSFHNSNDTTLYKNNLIGHRCNIYLLGVIAKEGIIDFYPTYKKLRPEYWNIILELLRLWLKVKNIDQSYFL